MSGPADLEVAALVLRAATQLVDGIQEGMAASGFTDVRPAHGFVFVRVSHGGATLVDIARHLGVTKQATSQLVDQLVRYGYLTKVANPDDARSSILVLTDRGWACTRVAEAAAARSVSEWEATLGAPALEAVVRALREVVRPGPLRPAW